jgi:serine/threonine protein kinase
MSGDRTQQLPRSELVGETIGGVLLEAVLSKTAHSLVVLGTQVGVERPAVVKLFPKARSDTDADARLLKEAGALSQLRHANIVTLYSVGIYDKDFPYLLMEYVPGETLKATLGREGPLPPGRALGIILQIVNALEEVHRLGMKHGNLGLHNILLEALKGSNQDLVKLVDFGLVGTLGGTNLRMDDRPERVWYMTPEEGMGGRYTYQSELYVCGVILYQLLTGYMPYRSQSLEGLWDEIVTATPPAVAVIEPSLAIYPEVQDLLDRALAKQPKARPKGARALRLIVTDVLGEIEARNEVMGQATGKTFPVIQTVERVKALPRNKAMDEEDDKILPPPISRPTRATSDSKTVPGLKNPVPPVPPPDPTGPRAPDAPRSRPSPALRELAEKGTSLPPPSRPGRSQAAMARRRLGLESEAPDTIAGDPSEQIATRVLDLNLDTLAWRIPNEARLDAAEGKPYALLAIHSPGNLIPPGLTQKLDVLLGATAARDVLIVAVATPKRPESWLPWLAARAKQYGLVVGIGFGRKLEGRARVPAQYTVRMALQAAQRAEPTQLVAGRHAVDGLGLDRYFLEFDRRGGRYSSFLRYAGIRGPGGSAPA